MKKLCILFFTFITVSFVAEEVDQPIEIFAAVKQDLEAPPAVFTALQGLHFQFPKVNVITGEYCEQECDLVVAGTEPISYRRFYNHRGHRSLAYGHWRVNPECLMVFNFELTKFANLRFDRLIGCGDETGSFLIYDKRIDNTYTFDPIKHPSYCHQAISGQKHPLNVLCSYQRIEDREPGFCFYRGSIKEGDGRERFFSTNSNVWPKDIGIFGTFPSPPYMARIDEEKRPNGNVICYEYIDYNKEKSKVRYYMLTKITAYNAAKTKVLGSLSVKYDRKGRKEGRPVEKITLTGSDERVATCYHDVRRVQTKKKNRPALYDVVLDRVIAPGKPDQHYNYRWDKAKKYFKAPYLFRLFQEEGRQLDTQYDLATGKVTAQLAPVGPNGEICPIARYIYRSDHTIVYDGENNKTLYRFDSNHRLTAIEKYQGEELYSIEKSEWDPVTGNLKHKKITDRYGNALHFVDYSYDENHNLIHQETYGHNHSHGRDVIDRRFSKDGMNLLLSEKNNQGKEVKWSYVPLTNLVASELVYDHGQICQRTFHFYDEELNSVCTKTIVDDGKSPYPNILEGVTYRRITERVPKRSGCCIGLPEAVVEKTIDSTGGEILLKRIEYKYHPSGKITQEDHYGADNRFAFSLLNEYDEKECLVSTQDALGNKTSYKYDSNFNLVEQCGPKPGMRKEWVYDLANRPIEEKIWEEDGSFLTRKKVYDKAGRIVAAIDECGFETRYEYDSLGREIAVFHSDGGVERKEYNILGFVIKETDPLGFVTCQEVNFRGQPLLIDHPDQTRESFFYNEGTKTLAVHISPQGKKTVYTYDIFDHVVKTQIFDPKGVFLKETSATFSPFCKLTETDGAGNTLFFFYDRAGRKIAEVLGSKETYFDYDPLGRVCEVRTDERVEKKVLDAGGQIVESRFEDTQGNLLEKVNYFYDAAGNCTHQITSKGVFETQYNNLGKPLVKKDPLGHITRYRYLYEKGYTEIITDPSGASTSLSYDERGQETEVSKKNPRGEVIAKRESLYNKNGNLMELTHLVYHGSTLSHLITHKWEYGPRGRQEAFLEAGVLKKSMTYASDGTLEQLVKPSGKSLVYKWDSLGRMTHLMFGESHYDYEYDGNDRIVSVKERSTQAETTRVYDILGNVVEEKLANGLTLNRIIDAQGRRKELLLPNGSSIHYHYKNGYLHTLSYKGATHTYAERDEQGNVTLVTLPCQLGTIAICRDSLSRWASCFSPFYKMLFPQTAYDSKGNLLHYHFEDTLGPKECRFSYNDLNQLVADNQHGYLYDSLNNRIEKDHLSQEVNNLCQVVCDGKRSYLYDADGNLIEDGYWSYEYDNQDRLTAITHAESRIEFTYDPFNRRMSKKIIKQGIPIFSLRYLWDNDEEIGAVDDSGNIVELRVLGEGLGAEIGAAVLYELQGKIYVPLHDHRGCVTALIDAAEKKCIESYRYTAFGEELTHNQLSPWRFSSKRVEPECGLIYFGRRFYSPELGRWITQDPQGYEDGYNLYAYLHNAPMNLCDPYGLWSSFADVRNPIDFLSYISWPIFKSIELIGQHLIPVAGVRDLVESVGRWGCGGNFFDLCAYRKNYNRITVLDGLETQGSIEYGNGMLTTHEQALLQAEKFQKQHGGARTVLLYNGTQGLVTDLIACGVAKLGVTTPYENMCANYYKTTLENDPGHIFNSHMHSQAGAHAMNVSRLLNPFERNQINMHTYGSATLIPKENFGTVNNSISLFDPIPLLADPVRYFSALISRPSHINFLKSNTYCPLLEHSISGSTYQKQSGYLGNKIYEKYFN